MGIDRIAMLKYGIPDLRAFFERDLRWLRHYGFAALGVPDLAGGVRQVTFVYDKVLMAQALAIVGEAGIHGMHYNGLMESWTNESARWKSKRKRISLVSAHKFSGEEFENYMILARRWRLVDRSKYREVEWKHGPNKSSYQIEDEVIRLTQAGWEFANSYDQPLLHQWWSNVSSNFPTIAISVLVGLLSAWLLRLTGLNQ